MAAFARSVLVLKKDPETGLFGILNVIGVEGGSEERKAAAFNAARHYAQGWRNSFPEWQVIVSESETADVCKPVNNPDGFKRLASSYNLL